MDKEYPVWVISARWNNRDYQNNGTSFNISHRIKYSDKVMLDKANKWWKKYCLKKYPNEIPELLELKCEYVGNFAWYMVWFCHKSLNRFETEEEAFKSFRNYFYNLKKVKTYDNLDNTYKAKEFEYCVMGAEDEWRWKYCQCKTCKRLKQTIINH